MLLRYRNCTYLHHACKINTPRAMISREDLLHTRNETKMMASEMRRRDLSCQALSIDTWLGIHALRIPDKICLENSSEGMGVLSRWELFVRTDGWYCLRESGGRPPPRSPPPPPPSYTLTHNPSISPPARGNWKCLQTRHHTMVLPVHQV